MTSSLLSVRLVPPYTSREPSDRSCRPFTDNIATNVYNVGQDTRGASEQLTRAHEYQRKAGRRMFYLLLVFLVVLTVVLLAVRSFPCAPIRLLLIRYHSQVLS